MDKKLPIFDIILNDEDLSQGVGRISLVDEPAIGVDWITLRKQPKMVIAKRECLGCPPNGDGTRVNGDPDRRCKGDGADKGGGAKAGGAKAGAGKSSDKNVEKMNETLNGLTKDQSQGFFNNNYKFGYDKAAYDASQEPFKQYTQDRAVDTGKTYFDGYKDLPIYVTDKLYAENKYTGDNEYHENKDGVYFVKSIKDRVYVINKINEADKAVGKTLGKTKMYSWNENKAMNQISVRVGEGNPLYKTTPFDKGGDYYEPAKDKNGNEIFKW